MPDAFGRPLPGEQAGGVDAFGRPIGGSAPQESSFLSSIPGAQTALSALAPALDFLSRGQYASAGFFDALINDDASILDALSLAGNELLSPTKRKSFTDVLRRSNPEFYANNPTASKVLGFLGDVALDPTTYLSFGLGAASKGARIGGRALTTIGETFQAAARSRLAGSEIVAGLRAATPEAAQAIGREMLTRLPKEVAERASIETLPNAYQAFTKTSAQIREALGGKLPAGVTEDALDELAQKISLERLGLPNTEALMRPLTVLRRQSTTGETVEAANDLIGRIASLSPEASASIFKPRGLTLQAGIPFTRLQAEIPLINRDILRAVGLDRLEGLAQAVGALPGIKQGLSAGRVIRGAFDRFFDLDPKYVQTITKLQDEYEFIKQDVVRDAIQLAGDIPLEGRERISKVMSSFESALAGMDDVQRLENAPTAFKMAMGATRLEPKEQAVVMSMVQGYARAGELERALGVSGQLSANFDPRVFRAIEGSADETIDWLNRIGPDGSVDVTPRPKSPPRSNPEGLERAIGPDAFDDTKVSVSDLGLPSAFAPSRAPGAGAVNRSLSVDDLILGRDDLSRGRMFQAEEALAGGVKAKGETYLTPGGSKRNVDPIVVVPDPKRPGKFIVSDDGNHRVALLKLRGYEGQIPVISYESAEQSARVADSLKTDANVLSKGADLSNAIAEGANPAQDAVLLYAQRVIQARQRLPRIQADAALKSIFGTSDPAQLPKRVANDWRYYGEYRFPTMSDEGNEVLSAIDWIQRKWKGLKTVVNPNFAPRQAVSNSLQSALVMGNNGWRAFDPRSYSAASRILWGNRPASIRQQLPDSVNAWLTRFTEPEGLPTAQLISAQNLDKADAANDLAKGLEVTTATGQKYTRDELELLAKQNGIIRGTGGFSGEVLKRSLESEIGLGARTTATGKAFDATKSLVNGYLGLSTKVEDTSRLALFINGLTMGDSPTQAAQRVNRALFDYNRSFSRFEQEVMKRLVPFYSFQRLALPTMLKTTLENPGAPATLNKVADLMGQLFTGDKDGQPVTLTQAQREVFGRNFLIEQPRVFRGFGQDGKAIFNMFSNVTPFDVLSLLTVTQKNGEIDWKRTAEKTIMGALTPFLKIPAELISNREFFNDKVIADARGYGGKGRLGAVKDKALDAVIPEPIKAMIGWEWGTDRRTGEQIAYVNPYLAYSMSQIAPPVANLFLKPLKDSESVLDRSMRILTGVSEQQVDFRESLEMQNAEDRKFIQELRGKVVAAQRTGRTDSLTQALEDYRNVLRATAERRARTASAAMVQPAMDVE